MLNVSNWADIINVPNTIDITSKSKQRKAKQMTKKSIRLHATDTVSWDTMKLLHLTFCPKWKETAIMKETENFQYNSQEIRDWFIYYIGWIRMWFQLSTFNVRWFTKDVWGFFFCFFTYIIKCLHKNVHIHNNTDSIECTIYVDENDAHRKMIFISFFDNSIFATLFLNRHTEIIFEDEKKRISQITNALLYLYFLSSLAFASLLLRFFAPRTCVFI